MNTERMHLLADLLETIKPVKFNMGYWLSHYDEVEDRYCPNSFDQDDPKDSMSLSVYDCNTAGCIAGWAIAMKNDLQATNEKAHNLFYYAGSNTIWEQHLHHLGLDENRSNEDQIEPKHAAYALRKVADGE